MATKKATKSNKVYVVQVQKYLVEPAFDIGYENDTYILGTYKTLERAQKAACDEVIKVLPSIYCEHAYGLNAGETAWGDWDELPETEAEKTEDYGYSQEGVIDLIRKAGGEVRIETEYDDIYFETTISTQRVKG